MPIQAEDVLVRLKAIGDEAGVKRFQEALKKAGVETKKSLQDTETQARKTGRALEDMGNQGKRGIDSLNRTLDSAPHAMRKMDASAMAIAGRFIGVAAAVETARRAFTTFADQDQAMRRIAIDAGVTVEEIKKMAPEWRKIASEAGFHTTEVVKGFNTLREYGSMAPEVANKWTRAIAQGAQAMGTMPETLARVDAALMNTMGISADRIEKMHEMLQAAVEDHQLSIQEMLPAIGKLGDASARVGMTGEAGMAQTLALIGSIKRMGNETGAAETAVASLYAKMADPSISKVLTGREETLVNHFRAMAAAGVPATEIMRSFFNVVNAGLDEGKINMAQFEAMFGTNLKGGGPALREWMRNQDKIIEGTNSILNASGRVARAVKIDSEGSAHAIKQMSIELTNVGEAFGSVLAELGVGSGLRYMAEELRKFKDDLKVVAEWLTKVADAWRSLSSVIPSGSNADPNSQGGRAGTGTRRTGRYPGRAPTGPVTEWPEENLPGRATGGPVAAGAAYTVGERGKERFVPHSSGAIISNSTEKEVQRNTTELAMLTQELHKLNDNLDGLQSGGGGGKLVADGGAGARGEGGGSRRGADSDDPSQGTRTGTGGGGDTTTPMGKLEPPAPELNSPTSPADASETLEDAIKRGRIPGGGRAQGGSADGDHTYTVGENGPEMLVPNKKGGQVVNPRALRAHLESTIAKSRLAGTMPSAAEARKYGFKTGSSKEWAHFMTGLAGKESSYKPGLANVSAAERRISAGAGSHGLFQLSPQDAINYKIQKTPFTMEQLRDPKTNADIAVKIMERRFQKGGLLGKGGAKAYWAKGKTFTPINQTAVAAEGASQPPTSVAQAPAAAPAASTAPTAGGMTTGNLRSALGGAPESATQTVRRESFPGGSLAAVNPRTYERRKGEPGEFNAARSGEFGKPGDAGNMTTVTLKDGQKVTVNKNVAGRFQGFANEMLDRGYPVSFKGGGGGYVNRQSRGGKSPSMHAYGTAMDINVAQNAYKGKTTNMPEGVEETAWKHGLSWGGRFGDPMHFEAMSGKAWASKRKQLEARQKPSTPTAEATPKRGDETTTKPSGVGGDAARDRGIGGDDDSQRESAAGARAELERPIKLRFDTGDAAGHMRRDSGRILGGELAKAHIDGQGDTGAAL